MVMTAASARLESLFNNMDTLQSQHGHVIISILKCVMKMLIHFQTSRLHL